MNLLIFVLTFLLVVSSISYHALGHFQANAIIRGIWERYLHVDEPCSFNAIVKAKYKKIQRSSGQQDSEDETEEDDPDPAATKIDAASGINFRFISDREYIEENLQAAELMRIVINRLILFLYGDQKFFQDFLVDRPQIIEEWILALQAANESEDKKIGKVKDLIKVVLSDQELQKFSYQLWKENPVSDKVSVSLASGKEKNVFEDCFEVSFKNYLNNKKTAYLRVYLLPRPILLVLLDGDPQALEEVIAKRNELKREVSRKTDPKSVEEASKEFLEFSQKFSSFQVFEPILNFQVTKTSPSTYE